MMIGVDAAEQRTLQWDALRILNNLGDVPPGKTAVVLSWDARSEVQQEVSAEATYGGFRALLDRTGAAKAAAVGLELPATGKPKRKAWVANPHGLGIVFGLPGRLERIAELHSLSGQQGSSVLDNGPGLVLRNPQDIRQKCRLLH
jgi:hypothetical protein